MIRLIGDQLTKLPDKQRKVLALYYFEDLRLREIAQVFGVTEARISQIHGEALRAFKSLMRKYETIQEILGPPPFYMCQPFRPTVRSLG
jgi:DNA-directed RNA polymerase specialized sigma24 family protein